MVQTASKPVYECQVLKNIIRVGGYLCAFLDKLRLSVKCGIEQIAGRNDKDLFPLLGSVCSCIQGAAVSVSLYDNYAVRKRSDKPVTRFEKVLRYRLLR